MLEHLKTHLEALSASNWEDYRAGLAPEAAYEECATMQRVEGADAYVTLVQAWKRAFPDLAATLVNGFTADDTVIAEVEWRGTHRGPFEGPLGTIAPTNRSGTVKAVMISRVKDGKIVETRHYFDLLTLLRQLGIAPMAGGPTLPARPEAQPQKH